MNPHTGEILNLTTDMAANSEVEWEPIPDEELPRVQAMNRHDRRKWAAEQRSRRQGKNVKQRKRKR